jgi:hypothetical protein
MKLRLSQIIDHIDMEQAMKLRDFRSWKGDDVLRLLGLRRRSSLPAWVWPGIGLAAVGVVVGVGAGLLSAPQEGYRLRASLRRKMARSVRNATERLVDLPDRMARAL